MKIFKKHIDKTKKRIYNKIAKKTLRGHDHGKKCRGVFMKRSELLEKLGEIENAKEICDFVMAENGKDISREQEKINALQTEIKTLKETHENELKAKDEELAKFNVEEIADLKKYKETNEAKIKTDKQNEAIKEFLKANEYSVDDVLMSYVNGSLKPDFNDDFKITNSDEILKSLSEKASQYKIAQTEDGARATTPTVEKPKDVDAFLQGFLGK